MAATDTVGLALASFGELTPASRTGGQGRVYRPERCPPWLDESRLVVKLYRRPVTAEAAAVLAEMVRWARSLPAGPSVTLGASTAWPLAVIDGGGPTVGIAMRDVGPRFSVPFLMPSGRREPVLLALEHLLGSDAFLNNRGLGVGLDTVLRARVAERVSGALAFLHQHGIAVGDIAPSNVLVSLAPVGACFIDCDSMVFRGRQALAPVETGDWNMPPEFAEPPGTRAADAYKLGLLVLRLFARSHDARTVAPHLRRLPTEVRDLLHRGLSPDAANRPPAGEWQRTLSGLVASGGLAAVPAPWPSPSPPRPRSPSPEPAASPPRAVPTPPPRAVPTPPPRALLSGRPPTSPVLRRLVVGLWLVALALAAGVLISRIEAAPPRPVTTTIYPTGPRGRIYPSIVTLSGPQSVQDP